MLELHVRHQWPVTLQTIAQLRHFYAETLVRSILLEAGKLRDWAATGSVWG
jgi:hypothetical protein